MEVQQSILSSDATILSFIGAILFVALSITGYFINRWIRGMESREASREANVIKREDAMNVVLNNLNETLSEVNTNLKVYQASMDGMLSNIKDKAEKNTYSIDAHEKHLQDHEIRLTIIERKR